MAKLPGDMKAKDAPMKVLIPAFVTSELKSAFQIGFLIFIPFLVIDMIEQGLDEASQQAVIAWLRRRRPDDPQIGRAHV